ncbi:hypothetical protein I3J05_28175 (plasmid) [Streptomyces clavuligerus]|uniref:Uncharacterized protein n=6 Tax=Streptomyces clavuligerus TaxID=1901 RepID=Q6TMM7_STRCL|nr:hypothetical protein [Streptomyces clavuligerus]AAQ93596.1 hypothetical protein pSCL2.9.69.3c [Streptomyces clavuligerus]ANW22648.1 hypothetical protein BB341_30565 [Streptomyces clavuligerus]AXU17507.1 hypothetical protein D1794_33735 [Streptomyces clavuligerus]EDY52634.1 conserved hypothetical protein [Streptomyces clavuligerus]MBY6301040.1 hypothetical protein [Streptomyces clavuligerus]
MGFDWDINFPTTAEIAALHGEALRSWVDTGTEAVAEIVGKPAERVRSRLTRTAGVKNLGAADDEDLRECLRVLRTWLSDPASYTPPAPKPKIQRPESIGQLPVPRTLKQAHTETTCGLCADPVKPGDLVGRMRDPKDKQFVPMGWLCAHCLYERREKPRRRDVVLRIFHHLFASSAAGLNAHECAVLRTWLTETEAPAASTAWRNDPLDTTVVRLETSVTEVKGTTWIAVPTAHTIITALLDAPGSSEAETALLRAVAQHLDEWQTNPQGIEARRYGTGVRYRAEVLKTTSRPTVLSERGGPFDLHHTPPPTAEPGDTADSTA